MPDSRYVRSMDEAFEAIEPIGFPIIIRPSFTLGGVGAGIAYNIEEFRDLAQRGLSLSPVHEVLLEESVIGWKEFELEVMRDRADNFVVICSIENIDPMGVHTGDSITVAPALTLTDKEYQRMRDIGRRIIRRVGVETGGSNIQFAINPDDGRIVVIEMNPRVSRSSALASKATGFPIAKIAAKLALGYTLDEIPNDITRLTPASFEPTIDYIVVKVPRWAFEKFPRADRTLTTQMKSVGEVMAIGRTFKEAFMKAFRSLELGRGNMLFAKSGGRINATAAVDGGRRRQRAAALAGGAERPADVGDLPRARARLGARGDSPPDQHRSLVPDAVQAAGRAQGAGGAGRAARHLARPDALAEARRLRRLADRQHARRRRGGRARGAARAGAEGRLQAHRHVRGGVRVLHAVPLRHLREGVRGGADAAAEGRSSSAAVRTASARASSSTTAACTPRSRCATTGSRR